MNNVLKFFVLWVISTILIIIIIFSYKIKKEENLKKSFYNTAKLISKQRVDAGIRVLSTCYQQKIENEKEKFLLIDKMIREFNLNKNFSYDNINVEFTLEKNFSSNYIFYKDVINENKIVYIYENIKYLKQKIFELIPTLFNAFRFNTKGYIFVYDDKGNCYYHYNKEFIGTNKLNIKRNGVYILKLIIKKAKEHPNGVYVKYLAFNPNGKPTPKISYVVYFKPLHLILGSGVYLNDLEKQIKTLHNELMAMFIEAEATMSFILLIIFFLTRRKR